MMDKLDELIMLSKLGDEQALTDIMTRYKGLVKNIASHYFVQGGDNDDIVQEGSLGLYKAIISFDNAKNNNFEAYASVIIKRHILNAIKASSREKNQTLNNSITIDDDNSFDIASSLPSPDESYQDRQEVKSIKDEIKSKLSQMEFRVYQLHLDGYDYNDIASILGLTPKSVDNALSRIKSKIKGILRGE